MGKIEFQTQVNINRSQVAFYFRGQSQSQNIFMKTMGFDTIFTLSYNSHTCHNN